MLLEISLKCLLSHIYTCQMNRDCSWVETDVLCYLHIYVKIRPLKYDRKDKTCQGIADWTTLHVYTER